MSFYRLDQLWRQPFFLQNLGAQQPVLLRLIHRPVIVKIVQQTGQGPEPFILAQLRQDGALLLQLPAYA